MYRYILKRILFVLITVFIVSFIIYGLMSLMPGNAGRSILGMTASQEAVDALNEQLGENDPFLQRYGRYVYKAFFKLDLGDSYKSGRPVTEIIRNRFPYTLTLAFASTAFVSVFGILIGVFSAVHQYSFADNLFIVLSMIAASMPQFWLGLLFILLFAVNLHLLPAHGAATWQGFILPVLTVSLLGTARMLRLVRAQMPDNINADFIRTARAKGATERTVIWKHAFESSSVPIINTIGVRFGSLLGGSTVIESVFAIPGLGSEIVEAIYNKDVPVITGSIIFLTVIYCLIILLVDIVQAFADPRIKAKYSS